MSVTKKSQFALALFCILSAVCFGQQKTVSETGNNQNDSEKPHTISIETNKTIKSVIASDNETQLFVSEKDGLIYAFDLETFQQLWMADLGGKTSSNVLESGSSVYIITSRKISTDDKTEVFTLWAIDKISGVTKKKVVIDGNGDFYLYKNGKQIYVVNDSSVSVFGENLETSVKSYAFEKEKFVKSLFDPKTLELFLVFENEVVKLSDNDGNLIAEKILSKTKNKIITFAFSDDLYFTGDNSGKLYAFGKFDKKLSWQFRAGGKISDIQAFGNKLVVSSFDNFIYCFGQNDGERIWKKRFPGRVSEIIKSDEQSLFVKSTYSDDFYNLSAESGDVVGQYTMPPDNETQNIKLQITTRLITISKTFSIDIYKKN